MMAMDRQTGWRQNGKCFYAKLCVIKFFILKLSSGNGVLLISARNPSSNLIGAMLVRFGSISVPPDGLGNRQSRHTRNKSTLI